jgi:uncharacterized protein
MRGDLAAIRALLQQGADVGAAQADGMTALHWAARRNDLPAVQLLLDAGAAVSAPTRYGVVPLYFAALNGGISITIRKLRRRVRPRPIPST